MQAVKVYMSGRSVRHGGRYRLFFHTHLLNDVLTVNASNGSFVFLAFWLSSVHMLEPV